MKFLVSAFGNRYAGMLITNLESIERSNPAAGIEVYYQDLPDGFLESASRAYPRVRFVETNFDFSNDPIQRISSKTLTWEYACRQQRSGDLLAFVDVDTIVVKDISAFLCSDDIDLVFTWKDETFQLNSGVLLAAAGNACRNFLQEWLRRTREVLQTPHLYAQANSSDLPYGGGDQMALHQILNYRLGEPRYEVPIGATVVRFRAEPCAVLNETNSGPIRATTHIIHYKGGWQHILLDGKPFSRHRPRLACGEMYQLYLATFQAALGRLNSAGRRVWTPGELGIAVPRYTHVKPGLLREILYAAVVARHWPRAVVNWTRGKASLTIRWLARNRGRVAPKSECP